MVEQSPKGEAKGPFDLEPNVAAGLSYLFPLVGGIVMLVGGGTNKFVRWAAAQSIVLWAAFLVIWVILGILFWPMVSAGLYYFYVIVRLIVDFAGLAVWLWTFITAFQGKEARVPFVAGITESVFKSAV